MLKSKIFSKYAPWVKAPSCRVYINFGFQFVDILLVSSFLSPIKSSILSYGFVGFTILCSLSETLVQLNKFFGLATFSSAENTPKFCTPAPSASTGLSQLSTPKLPYTSPPPQPPQSMC
jgi:hypothetical protein